MIGDPVTTKPVIYLRKPVDEEGQVKGIPVPLLQTEWQSNYQFYTILEDRYMDNTTMEALSGLVGLEQSLSGDLKITLYNTELTLRNLDIISQMTSEYYTNPLVWLQRVDGA